MTELGINYLFVRLLQRRSAMRRRLVVGGMLAALLVSVMAAMPSAAAAPSGRTGSYIVVLKDATDPSTMARAHADLYGARIGHVYRHALKGYSATLSSDRVAALKADPNVVAVAPDLPVHAFVQTMPTGIDRIDGELSSAQSGNGSGDVNADTGTIEVANMSLGGASFFGAFSGCNSGFDPMHPAICRSVQAGVTYAVAAGNSAMDANTFVPATYSQVITVSALADFNGQPGGGAAATCRADEDDTFANFSNFGADIDLIAPGVCILSTYLGSSYTTFSGTSMASPHVAGAAALYKSNNPGATPAQVKAALQNAGNLNWNDTDDPDPTKERLLNVDAI